MLLSDRIAAEIRRELAHGGSAQTYTLHALAKRFDVSLTPVRQAAAELTRSGHLRKLPNGRLAPSPRPPRTPAAALPPSETAEERIRREVVEGSLVHAEPVFLREEECAARFGVGRTILRRLFFRMAGEDLLEHVPRRGWRVRPVSDADLEAFLQMRELLEPRALTLAWDRLDHAFLAEVRAGNRPAGGGRKAQVDNRLHAHWTARCGNRYIGDFFARHGAAYAALLDHAALDQATASAMARQHRGILDAVLAGDRALACRRLVAHAQAQLANARAFRRKLAAGK